MKVAPRQLIQCQQLTRCQLFARRTVHVLLGGMLAAAFGLLAYSFATSVTASRSAYNAESMVGLGILAALVVAVGVTVALSPPVRPLEVAAARHLLGLDLPEVQAPKSWSSRRRGAVWLALNVIVGGIALLALLVFVPIGVGLGLYPFGSSTTLAIPGIPSAHVDGGIEAWWVAALSPVPIAVAIGITAIATVLLRRAGPSLLGPTDADRLALAEHRELALARGNRLAREIHDSVGHALTAIGIQAEAGERVLDRNPEFTRSALASIRKSSVDALDELDHVLGLLRGETAGTARRPLFDDLTAMVQRVAPDAHFTHDAANTAVNHHAAADAFRIAQEAMTNAVKHGRSPITLHVSVGNSIDIVCRNALTGVVDSRRRGRGLDGMRERALVAGGTVDVDHDEGSWTVHAALPATGDSGKST